MFERLD